jgi:diguanylate cyclase (GGDEF)-like protein/PAS domain S-box-containing protein
MGNRNAADLPVCQRSSATQKSDLKIRFTRKKFCMAQKTFLRYSLKTRITLATLLIFLGVFGSLWFYLSEILRKDMEHLLSEQQYSTVSMVAARVSNELDLRRDALKNVAASSAPAMLEGAAAMQALIEQRPALQGLFNGGILAHRLDGVVIASVPLSSGWRGVNQMDRDFVAAALKGNRSTVGRPTPGIDGKRPVVGMATPIHDAQGMVIGALAGEINLATPNFLDQITDNPYGKTGGYLLVAPAYRQVVTATDKTRILEVLPATGINPLLDRFIDGYEGSSVIRNPFGVEVLASARHIPLAGWYVAAVLPTEEAFAPVRAMQQNMLFASMLLTLLAGGLIWWTLRLQLEPMTAAASALVTMAATNQPPQPLPITRQDEIGQLIGNFNRVLAQLMAREGELKASEIKLHSTILELGRAEDELKRFFDLIPDLLCIASNDGHFLKINPAWSVMLGYSEAEILRTPFLELIHPDDRDATMNEVARQMAGRATLCFINRYRRKDGGYTWLEWRGTPAVDDSLLFASARDITESLKEAEALRDSESRIRAMLDTALYAVVEIDANGRITEWNRRAETLFGWRRNEVFGQALDAIIIPVQYREAHREGMARFLATGEERLLGRRVEIAAIRRTGEEFPVELAVTPLRTGDTFHFTAFIADISERKQMEAQIRQLAFHDPLTRLANRRLLHDRLDQAMAASKRSGLHGALMYLDLDNFKPLNDLYGHEMGDLLLIEVANRLRCHVREMDTVARFGGDEFVVLISELDVDRSVSTQEAGVIAEKIRSALADPYVFTIRHEGDVEIKVEHRCTATIGVVVFVQHEETQDDILRNADAAMYQAKEAGRNSIRFYSAEKTS